MKEQQTTETAQIAEWLGSMREARNQYDITNEATTVIRIDVEVLAERIAERIAARRADALAVVKQACDIECKSPGTHTGCSSHEPYRALRDAIYPPEEK